MKNIGKEWTEGEDMCLIVEYGHGQSIAVLARALGRSEAGIRARLERRGLIKAGKALRAQHAFLKSIKPCAS